MRVELIETVEAFEAARAEWDAVYLADPEAHYFVSWAWIERSLRGLGDSWRIIAVRDDGGELVAAMPLRVSAYLSKNLRVMCNEVRMPGLALWADYTGLICRGGREAEAITTLAGVLSELPWAQLELRSLRMSEFRLQLLLAPFRADTFEVNETPRGRNDDGVDNDVCPSVDLPDDFETYLSVQMSSNKRKKLRRFLRMVEGSDELRVTEATPETYERDVRILIGMWREMWKDRKEDADRMSRKFVGVLMAAAEAGDLYLPVLWSGDRPVGALGTYVDRARATMYVKATGRDQEWKMPPTGLVLHGHSIRWAIEQGIKTYDFMRGDEEYKYFYGCEDTRIRNFVVRTAALGNIGGELDPRGFDGVMQTAVEYRNASRWPRAEIAYRAAAGLRPDDAGALTGLARVLLQQQRAAEALEPARRLTEAHPDEASSWRLLGDVELVRGAFAEAGAAFRAAIERGAQVTDHFCLGCALHQQGQAAEAAEQLNRVLAYKVEGAKAQKLQAVARDLLGKLAEA